MNAGSIVFDGALWLAIPIALVAGLVSFLSPCVLPLVPGYLGFLGGSVGGSRAATQARAPRGRLVGGVLLFIAGFTLVFVAMGVLAGTLGRFFIQYQDLITRILGVVVIAMGLVFLGVFGFAQRTMKPEVRSGLGLIGAPLLGIAMGIGWAPCIGPTYTAILSISLTQADPGRAVLLAVAYSLGLGIPFLLLAVGFGWATRSVAFLRRHIRTVNIIGGVLLVVLGILMVTGVWTAVMSQLTGVIGSVELPL
ncbi:MAG: cytochrome C biogenesis protein [Microbacterium sp. SCN 70-200]|uniref:cytochrome c biogenesis CcdA family protein n=1 Tax=unclassified Microbacterium TaxID=2609290 RepID=UPI000868D37A|nr:MULTISPECIES: cytochrome c biogenesis protein CcdA [unclassified Microbacterium]MBN9215661.1 cytochrome c biogenesis protein CcdA [Microbacterium sp.]ODT41277.1 MAG: cytochrome C biogenesis protein [Microbacterium sp. SCN 70-200]OJV81744.1 MAG: cytochrome C biogenesis protein [Microbacterium sp. 70-16]